jgi:hypothetical protein
MTAQSTRILKEARPLLWPWCAVALAGALPLVHPFDWTPLIYAIGFFAVPLLATLPLGDEFQHRTLSLMLSQPIGRMAIWGEKLSVTVVAIVSSVLVFSLALRATSFHPGRMGLAFAGAWIVAITAAATFWTLFARSTVGGVALNIVVQSFLILIVPWANLAEWLRAKGYLSPVYSIVIPTVAIFCYAAVMLWLSGRSLARFQATGGIAGDDLLTAGPDVMPSALAGWLRCRPNGVVLNLVRKELRLLRPVWLISLLAAVGWACLTLFGLLYEQGFSRNFETTLVIVGVISTLMIATLAGSLSLGEEKTSGTHTWHLTLPPSAFRQWLIKLCMALFAGFVGAGLLPMLTIGRYISRSPHVLGDVHLGIGWMLGVLVLTFAAFWCACAVDGTVAAVLWVIPVTIALGSAGYVAKQFAYQFVNSVFSWRLSPFANFRFAWETARVFNWLELDHRNFWLLYLIQAPIMYVALAGGPALLLALVQSYRLFRAQLQISTRSVVRNLLPLVMLVFLCGFSFTASSFSLFGASMQVWTLFNATDNAIQKTVPRAANRHRTEPLELTGDDVAKAWPPWPLEENVRLWLRGAHITVTPDKDHPGGFSCVETPLKSTLCYFSATIHLADGTDISQSYDPPANPKDPWGRSSIHAHWPGAKGEESLWDR